jgi:hypothetical protein
MLSENKGRSRRMSAARFSTQEITSQVLGGIAKGLYPDLNDLLANIQVCPASTQSYIHPPC